ncbi:MAG: hypothetical protein E6J69_00085 [Deltaproteobacteria bacterium]|nr:MAG: hypothetical protein E6J69_00085 [Deltaproteobacteria bacterium]
MKRPGLLLVLPLAGMLVLGAAAAAENHPQPKPASRHPPAPPPRPSPAPAVRPGPAPPAHRPVARQPAVIVTDCWLDAHPFRGLAVGFVDYCRGHLGYAPGAPDCYTFADEVCTVFVPGDAAWAETRRVLPADVFPCPEAPEPPVCPRLTWQ